MKCIINIYYKFYLVLDNSHFELIYLPVSTSAILSPEFLEIREVICKVFFYLKQYL